MRLFIALDIEDAVRQRIARFVEGIQGFAPEARWVRTESLHITLKFVGERPGEEVEQIKAALARVTAESCEIQFRGYGFFPTARSARVFWVGVEGGPQLAALARAVEARTELVGIANDGRAFSPHLTLARGAAGSGAPRRQRKDSPNQVFQRLQEKLDALPTPEFGSMTAREFFLYQSQLSPKGSKYTKLARFVLQ